MLPKGSQHPPSWCERHPPRNRARLSGEGSHCSLRARVPTAAIAPKPRALNSGGPCGWKRGYQMVQNRRDGTENFAFANCGAVYEVLETPARDTGSAACEVCNTIMMKWIDAPIPLFRAKNGIEDARRRYCFHHSSTR